MPELDQWLKQRALQNEASGASRTFVACTAVGVAGYYSLSAASISHEEASSKVRRNMPKPIPAILLGRLAVDLTWQGKKLGVSLLQDAVLRITGAASIVGVRAILVHAMSDAAKTFYVRFGFQESQIDPMTLMVTIEQVQKAFQAKA